jgi:hypothetical protein
MLDQLNEFQKSVIYSCIILFIIFLVIASIGLYYINKNKNKDKPFPDVTQFCPDYWEDRSTNADGSKCLNVKNLGKSKNRTMDFTKSIWKGNQGVCNKSEWAKKSSLTWDGVTNNIRIPCKFSDGLVERDYLIVKNTDYAKQFDISEPNGITVTSQLDCENACDSTAGCNGFSYKESEGKCFLKNIKKGTEIPTYNPNGSIFVTEAGYKSYMDAENICSSEKGDGKCSVLKNNKCKAMLKEDGNVLIYDIANKPLWASNTYNKGNGPYSMKMQDDGNLVVYDVNNEEIWSSGTTDKGDGPYRAEIDESCTLTVYDSKNKNLWFGNEGNAVKQEANSCSSDINYGLCLKKISSTTARLVMQDDGNLCVYDNGDKLIWQSGSNGKGVGPYRLMMQPDGNLVIYDSKNTATWSTGTNGKGKPPYKLKMRKDLSLEIKSSTGIIWTNKYVKLDNTDYPGQFDIKNGGGSLLDGQNTCNETDGCNGLFYQEPTKHFWLKNVKEGTENPSYNKTGSMYVMGNGFKSYKEGFTSSMSPEMNEEEKKEEEKDGEGDNGGHTRREGFKTWRDIPYAKIEKTDYTGQFDIKNVDGTVDQCKELCTTTDNCNGFAYSGRRCSLKDVKRGSEYPRFRKDVDTYVMGDGVGYKSYKDAVPKFNLIQNTDYRNQGDLKSMQGSVDDCKYECDYTPGCNSFFYADTPKTCWLKGLNKSIAVPNYHSGGSLYEVAGTGLKSYKDVERKYNLIQNTDYRNQGDLKQMDGPKEDCMRECDVTQGCNSFFYADAANRCWLKGLNKDNAIPNYHSGGSLYEAAGTGLISYKDLTPCYGLNDNSPASSVKPDCLQKIWLDSGCNTSGTRYRTEWSNDWFTNDNGAKTLGGIKAAMNRLAMSIDESSIMGCKGKLYTSIGCWTDRAERAMPILEGHPWLTGNYQQREQAIEKCYAVAKGSGYKYFAIQHGGHCQGSNDINYSKKYGPSNNCANGKGGPWANDIYEIM